MDIERKNVALLSACQALLFTNSVTLIAINGLATMRKEISSGSVSTTRVQK